MKIPVEFLTSFFSKICSNFSHTVVEVALAGTTERITTDCLEPQCCWKGIDTDGRGDSMGM